MKNLFFCFIFFCFIFVLSCTKKDTPIDQYNASLPTDPLLALEQIDKDWESGKINILGTSLVSFQSLDLSQKHSNSPSGSIFLQSKPRKSRIESYSEAPWGTLKVNNIEFYWNKSSREYNTSSDPVIEAKQQMELQNSLNLGSIPLNFDNNNAPFSTSIKLPKEPVLSEPIPWLSSGDLTLKWAPTDGKPFYLVVSPSSSQLPKQRLYYQVEDIGSFSIKASDFPSSTKDSVRYEIKMYKGSYELRKIDGITKLDNDYFMIGSLISKSGYFIKTK
jgi:hypothetical protein